MPQQVGKFDFSGIPAADFTGIPKAGAPAAPPPSGGALSVLGDLAKGFGKGTAHTALDLGSFVGGLQNPFNPAGGNVRDAIDALYGMPGLSNTAFSAARDATAYANTPQAIGGGLEGLAEMAVPVGEAAAAIPTTAKAGAKFQAVMGAAKNVAVDMAKPGDVALRISQLAERGGSMPKAVRDLLKRATDPAKGPITYQEARDFASNISRISADEFNRLTPVIKREMGDLRVSLNGAIAQAAEKAGKGAEYKSAMREYAHAMQIRDAMDSVLEGAKKALPWATGVGAGTYAINKLYHLWSGGGD